MEVEISLKQIGPRIRSDVYDALMAESKRTRQRQDVLVEQAIIKMLKEHGHELEDDCRY